MHVIYFSIEPLFLVFSIFSSLLACFCLLSLTQLPASALCSSLQAQREVNTDTQKEAEEPPLQPIESSPRFQNLLPPPLSFMHNPFSVSDSRPCPTLLCLWEESRKEEKAIQPQVASCFPPTTVGGGYLFCKYWLFSLITGLNAHLLMVVEITTASAASLVRGPPHAKLLDGYLMYQSMPTRQVGYQPQFIEKGVQTHVIVHDL